ncbi:aldehyde dehydrogenase family protein [Pseudomonas citronellolis]|uniref:aldehyde dehydrogenase family protein n=1 Tax=Pseudomonas citronellolis TaxID=53408 RepID=UPI0023E3E06E|nr:aldehyde dehydrogenase family protein [Pseudomonas citronellolis]MDF3933789.1 aldehyde dehydrogenase family protein [Pseudomonas citronellolis]
MPQLKDVAYWRGRSRELSIEGRAFIAGAHVPASDGETFSVRSAIDGRELAQAALCRGAEVEAAVSAARAAFESAVWSDLAPRQRKAVLLRWAGLMREHADELALLETLDSGKPIADTTAVDIPSAIYCLEWFAELADKVGGEVPACDPQFLGTVTREPIGVVAAIVPWNYPLLMAAWKFAPALAAGNSLILKPSEKSPLSALRIAALAREAGIPDGVFNVLPGDGETGRLLSLHRDIDCLAFTGSGAVGRQIARAAADSNLKRVWLELGGKSANIVMADCPDLRRAAQAAAAAVFSNMGQVCSAGSRLLVQRGVAEAFRAELLGAARAYLPGDPLDPASVTGSLIDEAQYQRVREYIELGKREARLLFGGETCATVDGGRYLQPTVFLTDATSRIAREEIFGPVLSLIEFDHLDEAIDLANASEYGLAAAFWSADLGAIRRASRRLRAGTVWVNCYDELLDMNFPFGGFKESGNGRDNSVHALDKYSELKSTIIRC